MEESVGTVFFNGQFWYFLLERTNRDNELSVGKYAFGAEPTNTDLLRFYLNALPYLPVYKSEIRVRTKAKKRVREQDRITNKAKNTYQELQKKNLDERKKEGKIRKKADEAEKFALKRLKAREKRRGH